MVFVKSFLGFYEWKERKKTIEKVFEEDSFFFLSRVEFKWFSRFQIFIAMICSLKEEEIPY